MDNVIVVSDDDEDEAKDVVNGDSNSDFIMYVGHRTGKITNLLWSDLFQCAYKSKHSGTSS